MPDYRDNDPGGWCGDPGRGAALGRSIVDHEGTYYTGRVFLRRVRIDRQGYDPNGTYFGVGDPLYWYANDEGTIDGVFRAPTRSKALSWLRSRYPKARTR